MPAARQPDVEVSPYLEVCAHTGSCADVPRLLWGHKHHTNALEHRRWLNLPACGRHMAPSPLVVLQLQNVTAAGAISKQHLTHGPYFTLMMISQS
jgi:hypothetical protein